MMDGYFVGVEQTHGGSIMLSVFEVFGDGTITSYPCNVLVGRDAEQVYHTLHDLPDKRVMVVPVIQ